MAINDETLSNDIWNELRSKLVGNVFITNTTTSDTTAASILAQYNDKKPTRPQIIIGDTGDTEGGWKFGAKNGRKDIDVFIDCYAGTSIGTVQLKDQVCDILRDNDIDGIDLVGLTASKAFTNPNEVKYHIYNITATYLRE